MNFPKMESRKEAEFVALDLLIIPYSIEKEDLKALAQGAMWRQWRGSDSNTLSS